MLKKWIGCAAVNFHPGRPAGMRPVAIVVHVMEGTLTGTDSWFNDPKAQVSAHYGVGRSGEVHQYVEEQDTAFHAGTVVNPTWTGLRKNVNPNFYTIGIEHEGTGAGPWPWPDAQLAASAALIGEIAARWNIPLTAQHIVTHHSIRASKPCPGEKVVLQAILDRIPAARPAPEVEVPKISEVTALRNVNLRLQEPNSTARIVRVILTNTRVKVAGFTDSGQRLFGNPRWYRDADGNYFWAGATDVPHPV